MNAFRLLTVIAMFIVHLHLSDDGSRATEAYLSAYTSTGSRSKRLLLFKAR